jgi:hypothetical protein
MKKNSGKDEPDNSEAVANLELLFCNDALVVDYLNALLASEPAVKMDFREIHFVHQDTANGRKSGSPAYEGIGNSIAIETETSIVEKLKAENENLKFQSELSSIDVQVLRSENDKLKVEKVDLQEQLKEIGSKLNDSMSQLNESLDQNEHLKASVADSREQLDRLTAAEKDKVPSVNLDSVNVVEIPPEPVSDVIEKGDSSEIKIEPINTVEHGDSSQQIIDNSVQSENTVPDREIVTQDSLRFGQPDLQVGLARSIISPTNVADDRESRAKKATVSIFSREKTAESFSTQSFQPVSKVIKQNQAEQHQFNRQGGQNPKVSSPVEFHASESVKKTADNPEPAPLKPVVEVKKRQDATIVVSELTQLIDITAEIDLPVAPTPQAIVRRDVKFYEELQKESESVHKAEKVHTLIL